MRCARSLTCVHMRALSDHADGRSIESAYGRCIVSPARATAPLAASLRRGGHSLPRGEEGGAIWPIRRKLLIKRQRA